MGRGQVFGKVTQLFSESALLLLVIDKLGYGNLTGIQIIMLSLIGAFLLWFGGWLYVIFKMDIVQTILNRDRDVLFRDMHRWLKDGKSKSKDGR